MSKRIGWRVYVEKSERVVLIGKLQGKNYQEDSLKMVMRPKHVAVTE
jgi:hypothetical protein